MKLLFTLIAFVALATPAFAADKIIEKLQATSVTVKSGTGQGSGTLVTRQRGNDTYTFVWTAGHVVDHLRKTREIIDGKSGTRRTVVEFEDASIVQEFKQGGRRIGEVKMDAKVIRYSDAEQGEDLALLQVRKINFVPADVTTTFYLDEEPPAIGTELYHVGSLLGQFGANSLTTGVISQIGRVLELGANGVTFDQTTATAFPGSSGGGMYLKADGRYVGMLVRGAGEGFNFIVPVRRLAAWAKSANVEWAVNPAVAFPTDAELAKLPVEDSGITFSGSYTDKAKAVNSEFPFMLNGEPTLAPPEIEKYSTGCKNGKCDLRAPVGNKPAGTMWQWQFIRGRWIYVYLGKSTIQFELHGLKQAN